MPAGVLGQELHNPYFINLYVLYAATRSVEIFADLRNITDNHYALGGFGLQGRAIPQETFAAMFGVRLKW